MLAAIQARVVASLQSKATFLTAIRGLKSAAEIYRGLGFNISYYPVGDLFKYVIVKRPEQQVIAISDLHSGYNFFEARDTIFPYLIELFASMLTDPEKIVIFTGDAFDRVPGKINAEILLFLLFLQETLPGRFFYLLGNHELSWMDCELLQSEFLAYLKELGLTSDELLEVRNKILAALITIVIGPGWIATHSLLPKSVLKLKPIEYRHLHKTLWFRMVLGEIKGWQQITAAELARRALMIVNHFFREYTGPVYVMRGHDIKIAVTNPYCKQCIEIAPNREIMILTTHIAMAVFSENKILLPTIVEKNAVGVRVKICEITVKYFLHKYGIAVCPNFMWLIAEFNKMPINDESYLKLFNAIGQMFLKSFIAPNSLSDEALEQNAALWLRQFYQLRFQQFLLYN